MTIDEAALLLDLRRAGFNARARALRVAATAMGLAVGLPVALATALAFGWYAQSPDTDSAPSAGTFLEVSGAEPGGSYCGARVDAFVRNASNRAIGKYWIVMEARNSNGEIIGTSCATGDNLPAGESHANVWYFQDADAADFAKLSAYLSQAKDTTDKIVGRTFYARLKQ